MDDVRPLLAQLADKLERREEQVADRIEAAYRSEIPEYRGRSPAFVADSQRSTRAAVQAAVRLLREEIGADTLVRSEAVSNVARRRAEQGVPLHAVIRTLEVGSRVFFEEVALLTDDLGPSGGEVRGRMLQAAFDVVTRTVAVLSDAYVAARVELGERRRRAADDFFTDVAMGLIDDSHTAKAMAVGLQPARGYGVVVAACDETTGTPSPATDAELRMCVWRAVGTVGVLIVPVDDHGGELTAAAARLVGVLAGPAGAPPLVSVGRVHEGLAGIKASLDDALRVHSLARRLGHAGVATPDDVALAALLAAAPDVADELASVLSPLLELEATAAGELLATLRAYLEAGMSTQAVAARLYLHRNTVRSRLRRIEELLGQPIAPRRLMLELALIALDLRDSLATT